MPKVILIAEDDDDVRDLAELVVGDLGYEVISAPDGAAALIAFRAQAADALFTEIMMPRMNGQQLVAEIRRLNPQLPVICTSGYEDIGDKQVPCEVFLRKPYKADDLRAVLRRVVGEPNEGPAVRAW